MRSTTHLQERVTEVLGALWKVDTSRIRVTAADDGVVVLEGFVYRDHDRRAVEAAARSVAGVGAVVSAVTVDGTVRGFAGWPTGGVVDPYARA